MNNSKVTKSGMELPILTFGSTKIDSPTRVDCSMKVDGCEKNMEPSLCRKGRPFSKALNFLDPLLSLYAVRFVFDPYVMFQGPEKV